MGKPNCYLLEKMEESKLTPSLQMESNMIVVIGHCPSKRCWSCTL